MELHVTLEDAKFRKNTVPLKHLYVQLPDDCFAGTTADTSV